MADSLKYLKAAFLLPANLVALPTTLIATVAAGQPLGVAIALAVEAAYLAIVANAPPFQRAVRARHAGGPEGTEREVAALLEDMAPSQREHYLALKQIRDRILENYRKLPGGRLLAATSEQRVDALLTSFVRLLATLNNYRKYLNLGDRKNVERELEALVAEVEEEANPRIKEVKQKRVEILRKRVQRFQQAEESREIVSHQLAGIEDVLRLTHEQSIAIRDPEMVTRQLEALTAEVQSTEETVREMERFMEFTEPLSTGVRVR
ncbi:MAG TPA: hypothetical protein VEM39_06890 [Myxococcaceae bacterium]|nr:hypothetical protein [Myxococcaceae bacterium]